MHVHTSAFFTCKNSKVQTRSVIFMFILHVNEYISVLEIVPPKKNEKKGDRAINDGRKNHLRCSRSVGHFCLEIPGGVGTYLC